MASRSENRVPRYYDHQRSMGDPAELVTIMKLPVDGLDPRLEEAAQAWEAALGHQRVARQRVTDAEKAVADAPALDVAALSALLASAPDGGIGGDVALPTDAVEAAQAELVSAAGFLMASDMLVGKTWKRLRASLLEAAPEWLPKLREQVGKGRSMLAAAVYSAELELAKMGDTLALVELLERTVAVEASYQARVQPDWRDDFPAIRPVQSVDAAQEANRALRGFVGELAHVPGGELA